MRSTTLCTISGLLRAATGEILLDGRALHRSPAHEILALSVAHCREGRRLFARMTVEENLRLETHTPPRRGPGSRSTWSGSTHCRWSITPA